MSAIKLFEGKKVRAYWNAKEAKMVFVNCRQKCCDLGKLFCPLKRKIKS